MDQNKAAALRPTSDLASQNSSKLDFVSLDHPQNFVLII
jgi:hypothetical protein